MPLNFPNENLTPRSYCSICLMQDARMMRTGTKRRAPAEKNTPMTAAIVCS